MSNYFDLLLVIILLHVNPLWAHYNHRTTDHYTTIQCLVHWPLMGGLLHLVQRRGAWAGCDPAQSPPRCTKCNSPPRNGQCTNFIKVTPAVSRITTTGLLYNLIDVTAACLITASDRARLGLKATRLVRHCANHSDPCGRTVY